MSCCKGKFTTFELILAAISAFLIGLVLGSDPSLRLISSLNNAPEGTAAAAAASATCVVHHRAVHVVAVRTGQEIGGAEFSSSCPGSNASALVVTEPREDGSAPGANPASIFRSDARSSDGVGCSVNAPRAGGFPCFPAGAGFLTPRIGRSFRFGAFCHYLSAGRRLGAAYVLSKGLLKDPGAVSGPFPTGQSL
jgi:hypothetical protein